MQIKQLHALKNHIKQHNLADSVFDTSRGRDYENFVASVIYHRTLPLTIEHLKDSGKSAIQAKDAWFAKDTYSDAYINWQKGMEYVTSQLSTDWCEYGKIKGLWSKVYKLGV